MTRNDWQWMATERLRDAKALLSANRWSAAYYLTGYAVECGLKSCVLVRVAREGEVIFVDRRFSDKCWTHNLEDLLGLAGLGADFSAALAADVSLSENWERVAEWNEASRYVRNPKEDAKELFQAVADKNHGVLQWIKARW